MTLLCKLLARGDYVAITNGRLTISPASGCPVPDTWLKSYRARLLAEIATCTATRLFSYEGYSTGRYSIKGDLPVKSPGVTLTYYAVRSDEFVSVTFNAELDRKRTTKGGRKGSPLPVGQFRVTNRHKFLRYWDSTGIERPLRLSSFHDCMGKLRDVIMTAEIRKGKRLDKDTIRPAAVSFELLRKAMGLPDNSLTKTLQLSDNYPTNIPDKESDQSHATQGFEGSTSACNDSQVLSNQVTTNTSIVRSVVKEVLNPATQSNDDWLAEYGG